LNNKDKQNLKKYLHQYSQGIDTSFCHDYFNQNQSWQHVITIPACGESTGFVDRVFKNNKQQSVLLVLIINRPDEHSKTEQWYKQNIQLNNHLRSQAKQVVESETGHCLLLNSSGVDCLLLDFNNHPFSNKQGVGLARKIAADTSLSLINDGIIKHPWIFSTDADVELPAGYFETVNDLASDNAAVCLNFKHVSEDESMSTLQSHYDFKLRYYQQGVSHIESCYHYIPLGSTLIVNAQAYVQVRGFPCRSGGEDFYILNKLAKVGHIYQPEKPVVKINIRFSDRVPFGTGPALQKLADDVELPQYYHPEIFHIIKEWRQRLILYFNEKKLPEDDYGLNEFWQISKLLIKACNQYKTTEHWQKFIDDWLDAFKILKSVHFLREQLPSLQKEELVVNHRYQEIWGKTGL
jgi:hypothetical protein